jgi:hypothetical protein
MLEIVLEKQFTKFVERKSKLPSFEVRRGTRKLAKD